MCHLKKLSYNLPAWFLYKVPAQVVKHRIFTWKVVFCHRDLVGNHATANIFTGEPNLDSQEHARRNGLRITRAPEWFRFFDRGSYHGIHRVYNSYRDTEGERCPSDVRPATLPKRTWSSKPRGCPYSPSPVQGWRCMPCTAAKALPEESVAWIGTKGGCTWSRHVLWLNLVYRIPYILSFSSYFTLRLCRIDYKNLTA